MPMLRRLLIAACVVVLSCCSARHTQHVARYVARPADPRFLSPPVTTDPPAACRRDRAQGHGPGLRRDFDGDGRLDLAQYDSEYGRLTVCLSNGKTDTLSLGDDM